MITDGLRLNDLFRGYRGFRRCSIKIGSNNVMSRSLVVDLAARKVLNRSVTVVDRARASSPSGTARQGIRIENDYWQSFILRRRQGLRLYRS